VWDVPRTALRSPYLRSRGSIVLAYIVSGAYTQESPSEEKQQGLLGGRLVYSRLTSATQDPVSSAGVLNRGQII
jgi:hypothetical protein